MDRCIPLDHGHIVPAGEIKRGSKLDLQRRVRKLLRYEDCDLITGLEVLLGTALDLAARDAATPQHAQRLILKVGSELQRVAPSVAQAHFEFHHGGARG